MSTLRIQIKEHKDELMRKCSYVRAELDTWLPMSVREPDPTRADEKDIHHKIPEFGLPEAKLELDLLDEYATKYLLDRLGKPVCVQVVLDGRVEIDTVLWVRSVIVNQAGCNVAVLTGMMRVPQ